MPKRGTGMQSIPKFAATALGGPKRLRGNFLLADMAQVPRKELWENEFRNVRLVVNFIGHHHTVEYPKDIAATMEVAIVDLRNKDLRHPHFTLALPRVEECLEGGADVLVHCRESYHRAPLATAAFIRMLTGVNYQVVRPTYRTPMACD